jgi:hypothetical protein
MPADAIHQRLTHLRNGLLRLHMTLLTSERASYEKDVARIGSPAEYLNLALNDPWFAWLREISQFVVMVDETLDFEEPVSAAEAEQLIARARALISPSENGDAFAKRYFEAMQRDPEVVLAHSEMVNVFASLGV